MVNERKESELFELSNENIINPTSIYTIPIQQVPYNIYSPFNYCVVTNNSNSKVRLIINDTNRKLVPAGTIMTFDASTFPAIWSIRVQNIGTTDIAVEEIDVAFQKVQGLQKLVDKISGWGLK